ncbi:hypothetical protein GCM10023320_12580 [Pseudonocardia adelaidensis]|uniref:Carboxymuconolactone decarboxylase-like domain-containing protein n=1 Tax=Pseudonocardia adelaidensis TaxID=648754 RepID=A0ABP9NDE2_9PSEU
MPCPPRKYPGQLGIALDNGVTPEEIVEAIIHIEAYGGAARAFDSYQIAQQGCVG